jgi:lipoprotein signal peptidase
MSFWLFRAKISAKCFLMCGFALAISFFLFCIPAQNFLFVMWNFFFIFGGALGNLIDHFFVGRGHRFS